MIILRQKIFFDYSKYTKEEAAKIKEGRDILAAELKAKRGVSQAVYEGSKSGINDVYEPFIKSETDKRKRVNLELSKEKELKEAMQKRNADYEKLLKESAKEKSKITSKYQNKIKNSQPVQQVANNTKQKTSGFIKKAWNGEVGKLGKTGNRALMIGVPTLSVAGGTALALRKKNNKKETK